LKVFAALFDLICTHLHLALMQSIIPYPTTENTTTAEGNFHSNVFAASPLSSHLLTKVCLNIEEHTDQIAGLFTTAAGHLCLQFGLLGSLSGALENAPYFPWLINQFGADCLYLQTQGLYITWETLQEAIDGRFIVEAIINSFLLYNLGLVMELQSIFGVGIGTFKEEGMAIPSDSFQSRQFHANRSRFMYLKCRLMLDLAGVARYQATGIPLIDLLSMALYNNSAYAAFADGQYEICRDFFLANQAYIHSVVTMPAFFNWNPETVAVISRYTTNFLLNSYTLRMPNVASAA